MTTDAYVAPELTELGILNVDTLSKSGGGKGKGKGKGKGQGQLGVLVERDRDQNDPYCDKIPAFSDSDICWEEDL